MPEFEIWDDLIEAERKCFQLRHVLRSQSDAVDEFRGALHALDRRGAALRALEGASDALIEALIADLFDLAIGDAGYVGLARAAILGINEPKLSEMLKACVSELLLRDDLTDWEYRRVCELLEEAHEPALMNIVVEQAGSSDDPDILEVADDYR